MNNRHIHYRRYCWAWIDTLVMPIVPLINILFVQVGAQWFTVLTELLAMFDHHHLTALSTEYGSSYLCSVNRFRSVVSHNSFCTLHSTIIICPVTLVFTLVFSCCLPIWLVFHYMCCFVSWINNDQLTWLSVDIAGSQSVSWLLIWWLLRCGSYDCIQNVINAFRLWTMATHRLWSCQCMLAGHFWLTFVYTHNDIKVQNLVVSCCTIPQCNHISHKHS